MPPGAEPATLLVEGGLVITLDGQRRVLQADVAIREDRILAVEPGLRPRYPEALRIDASRHVVTPGLVDAHVHLTEHAVRGLVPDDASEDEWLSRWLLPVYSHISVEEEQAAAQLAVVEMLRTGTTSFCEAGTLAHPIEIAPVIPSGMKAILGGWTWDLPPEPAEFRRSTDQALAQLDAWMNTPLHNKDLTFWPLVLGIGTASHELIRGAKELARRHGCGFGMMHRTSQR
ncbi:MAG: amidohydrolase family protein, partial [Chloroflexi bacterium]|nr:amidohydrolase family protein [Chloroflexota bacterium]